MREELDIAELLAFCFAVLLIPFAALFCTVNALWLFFEWLDSKVGLRAIGLGFLFITLIGLYGLEKECSDYRCLHNTGNAVLPLKHGTECEAEPTVNALEESPTVSVKGCLANLPWRVGRGNAFLNSEVVKVCFREATASQRACLLQEVVVNEAFYGNPRIYYSSAITCSEVIP